MKCARKPGLELWPKISMAAPESLRIVEGPWDDRVLAFSCGETVTVFAVLAEHKTFLIDTLFSAALARALAEAVLQEAERRGSKAPLCVINTHADWDHVWGNGVFGGKSALFPAPIIGSLACAKRLLGEDCRNELENMRQAEPCRFEGAEIVLPDLRLGGEAVLDGGDLTLRLIPAPGHQPDQLAVWIPEIKTLFPADAAEDPLPFAENPGNVLSLEKTLRILRALEPSFTLPCHAVNLLDACQGGKLLERNIFYIGELKSIAGQILEAGGSSEEFAGKAGFLFEKAAPADAEKRAFYREAHDILVQGAWALAGGVYESR